MGRRGANRPESEPPPDQLTFFGAEHPAVDALRRADPDNTTPMEALRLLEEIKRMVDDA